MTKGELTGTFHTHGCFGLEDLDAQIAARSAEHQGKGGPDMASLLGHRVARSDMGVRGPGAS